MVLKNQRLRERKDTERKEVRVIFTDESKRENGSKQLISCLDKALSVAEAWHTVFSLTDTSQRCACATHTQKHTCTSRRMESFSGQSSFCLRLRALLFAAIVFRHSQTYTTTQSRSFTYPATEATAGKCPLFITLTTFQPSQSHMLNLHWWSI